MYRTINSRSGHNFYIYAWISRLSARDPNIGPRALYILGDYEKLPCYDMFI